MTAPDSPNAEELARRLGRERKARQDAESIAENATSDLYSAIQELKTLNDSMRDFIAIASHDLRSPLTTVVGFSSTLVNRWDDFPDGRKQEYLAMIERAGRRLTSLVDDLLTISLIDAGSVEAHKDVVELSRAANEAMDDFSENATKINLDIGLELAVMADAEHVQRILVNYVSNALKYGEPPVRVHARETGGWVEIRVCDQGSGVPDDFIPRLFGRFSRAQDPATRAREGTGLGLSIVRGLAEANGGEVWYEPNRPHGSCFAVRLPSAAA